MDNSCTCGGTGIFKVISDTLQVITCDLCGEAVESERGGPVWAAWIENKEVSDENQA